MEYVQQFLDFCQYQRGLAVNTINGYRWDLRLFMDWLEGKDLELTAVKIRDVDSFVIALRKEGKSVQTVNRKIYCLKMFYRYLQRIEVIEKNPLDFVKNIRQPKRLPKYLTEEQQKALIGVASRGLNHPRQKWASWLTYRDYLMVVLLLDTGVRISELCKIRKSDINFEEGILRVIGKGSREREVVLSNRCLEAVRKCPGNGSNLLFLNQQGRALGTRHAFRFLRDLGKLAGIANLHPHLLRHTHATNLRRKGADLLLIKEALGHSSVSTTEIYAHIGGQEYKEKLRSLIN